MPLLGLLAGILLGLLVVCGDEILTKKPTLNVSNVCFNIFAVN